MGALSLSPETAAEQTGAVAPLLRPDELGGARVVPPKDGSPLEFLTGPDEVDPFAGVFALGVFLGVLLFLFVATRRSTLLLELLLLELLLVELLLLELLLLELLLLELLLPDLLMPDLLLPELLLLELLLLELLLLELLP